MAKQNKEKKEELVIPSSAFEIEGQKYKFKLPKFVRMSPTGSQVVLAVDAIKDADLLQELVVSGSGVIVKIDEKGNETPNTGKTLPKKEDKEKQDLQKTIQDLAQAIAEGVKGKEEK